ncbi:MAG: ABC transporter ATP-binding protein [Firmicutes bacterium]|nr:ABC transporter ATP-binding protein [Bacillota bacterium]
MTEKGKLLEVSNLKTQFNTEDGLVKAVDGVSFSVKPGEVIGIVGESGCGKSITAMSVMRLIPKTNGEILKDSSIKFAGRELTTLTEQEMRGIRGNDIAMIFQEPMTSLNPVYTVGNQIEEVVKLHQKLDDDAARAKSIEMIKLVGIPNAERIVDAYPHSLSGGMRQRVMIAMALSCNPKLLIADEPTTALDVTIQAQILELMKELKEELDSAIMLITHDLGVVAEMAQHVVVMYSGKVVEDADVVSLFKKPRHPYTIGLLNSKPKVEEEQKEKLYSVPGSVPNPLDLPSGCYFHPRCEFATDKCREKMPELEEVAPGHTVRCWHADKTGGGK